jgi:hypothetical protein
VQHLTVLEQLHERFLQHLQHGWGRGLRQEQVLVLQVHVFTVLEQLHLCGLQQLDLQDCLHPDWPQQLLERLAHLTLISSSQRLVWSLNACPTGHKTLTAPDSEHSMYESQLSLSTKMVPISCAAQTSSTASAFSSANSV